MYLMQGLVFVVDSNDRERLKEAKDELERMVSQFYLSIFCVILGLNSILLWILIPCHSGS